MFELLGTYKNRFRLTICGSDVYYETGNENVTSSSIKFYLHPLRFKLNNTSGWPLSFPFLLTIVASLAQTSLVASTKCFQIPYCFKISFCFVSITKQTLFFLKAFGGKGSSRVAMGETKRDCSV